MVYTPLQDAEDRTHTSTKQMLRKLRQAIKIAQESEAKFGRLRAIEYIEVKIKLKRALQYAPWKNDYRIRIADILNAMLERRGY
jgi:hypothetical protein